MANIQRSKQLISHLHSLGVTDYIVCSGARCAPLAMCLEKANNVVVESFFEERSAAFYALGKIKKNHKPVAVVTTSGTAVAELLPACIEAYYAGYPLVLITADRPESYRGSGAPQVIKQNHLFYEFTHRSYDFIELNKLNTNEISLSKLSPTHINICFDEPLLDEEVIDWDIPSSQSVNNPNDSMNTQDTSLIEGVHEIKAQLIEHNELEPLVIIAQLENYDTNKVKQFILNNDLYFYAESSSGLRGDQDLEHLSAGECSQFVSQLFEKKVFNSVIRIGGIPTLRFWRDLEKRKLKVTNISRLSFTGHSFNSQPNLSLAVLLTENFLLIKYTLINYLLKGKESMRNSLQRLCLKHNQSEPSFIHKLSLELPENSSLFLSNSLSLRTWDLVSNKEKNFKEVYVNRGANGIDGIVSTFMGTLSPDVENILVIGDLSALYDLIGLWPLLSLKDICVKIFIVNNSGGKIFSKLFKGSFMQNEHGLNFSAWAEMFNLPYVRWDKVVHIDFKQLKKQCVIELVPDLEQSELFWNEYSKLKEF